MRSTRMGSVGRLKAGLRPRRLLVLAFLAGAVALAVVFWSWIGVQARAAVVLSSVVLEAPVLTPVVQALTREPVVEDVDFDGKPSFVAKPAGEGPWPAILFVNGTIPEGRTYPEVQNLARGLARAGYLVVVPDLPGLTTDEITEETVSSTVEAARAVADRPDARYGRVGLVGVSTGATLSLLAAQDPAVNERISVVAGVAPYTDIRTVLAIATTGHYREDGEYVPHDADPFLSYVIANSLLAALPSGKERDVLRAELAEVDRLDPTPLAGLRDRPTCDLSPEARSVVELLANTDPERFDELYAALPPRIREGMEKLSPLDGEEEIEAPVELASGERDKYFPVSESFAVGRIAPDHRVTVSEAIDHSEIGFSDIPAFLKLDGFVVRSLHKARRAGPDD